MKDIIKFTIKSTIKVFLKLIPLDERLVILEGNKSYDDNARAVFELMLKNGLNSKYKFVWFVDHVNYHKHLESIPNVKVRAYGKGFKSRTLGDLWDELIFLYYNCSAKVAIFCNALLGFPWVERQQRIYLGHGLALKNVKGKLGSAKHFTSVISLSPFFSDVYGVAIPGCSDLITITGYPRNDFLYSFGGMRNRLLTEYKQKLKIIWMPTFKHNLNSNRNDFSVERDSDVSLLNTVFIEKLNKVLQQLDILLVIKFHPFQDLNYVREFNKSNVITMAREDVERLGCATYELLSVFDALITDFSSVVYDFLLLDRPVAFDLTDQQDYQNGIGFIVDNIEEFMPGERILNEDDFIQFVQHVARGDDSYASERERVRNICHTFEDDKSSQRVVNLLNLL